jgi:thiol-disulfide isomerase/thioredoxin
MSKLDTSPSRTSTDHPAGWRKYSSLLLNAVLLLVAFIGISAFQARGMLSADRQAAPDLQAPTLQDSYFDLDEVGNRATLVYFFAPWCTYCALSSDNLVRLRRLRDEKDLQIVAVALDWKNVAEVSDYAEKHELNIPVLLGDADIMREWKVYGFPTYYVLDSKQRVAKRDIGYSTQLGLWWRSWNVN